jgi:hypothetical protein
VKGHGPPSVQATLKPRAPAADCGAGYATNQSANETTPGSRNWTEERNSMVTWLGFEKRTVAATFLFLFPSSFSGWMLSAPRYGFIPTFNIGM